MIKNNRPSEPQFDENYTLLRNLNEGDVYLSKSNYVGMYLKDLGDDKHLLKNIDIVAGKSRMNHQTTDATYSVPHGRYPVFKMINQNNNE